MATVTDDPLSKKVEMTNWEKVGGQLLHTRSFPCLIVGRLTSDSLSVGKLYQLQVRAL